MNLMTFRGNARIFSIQTRSWTAILGRREYIFILVYGCTVVQDQCTVYTLYYFITRLPVYPNTVHGHCTTVVLDTSNIVYCISTLKAMHGAV